MKNKYALITMVFLVFLSAMSLPSCRKTDDEVKKTANYIEFKGTQDDLTKGALNYYGNSDGESFNFDVALASPDFDIPSEKGKGSIIFFEMFSGSDTELENGTYTYDQTYNAFTFDESSFMFKYNTATDDGDEDDITSGSVKISHTGEIYTIEFLCMCSSGNSIKGMYSGTLVFTDLSGTRK